MKKLAIVGTNENGRNDAPWEDQSFDIWVFNEAPQYDWCKRWTACFQMHRAAEYSGPNMKAANHWEWLQTAHGKPIYLQAADERVPDGVAYPLEAARAMSPQRAHFTSTPVYALVLGVMKAVRGEYSEIHIYGINLSLSNTEYTYQLPCWRYWVGYCDGAGVPLTLHTGNEIFRSRLYGYEGAKFIDAGYFAERTTKYEGAWKAAEKHITNARRACERALKNHDAEKFPELLMGYQQACLEGGQTAGRLREAQRYQVVYDRQEFERSAAQAQIDGAKHTTLMDMRRGVIEYLYSGWKETKNEAFTGQLLSLISMMGQHAYDAGCHKGTFVENMEYRGHFDQLLEAGG